MLKVFGVQLKITLSQHSICVEQISAVAIGNAMNSLFEIKGATSRYIEQLFAQSCLLIEGNIKIKINQGEKSLR